jgi:hypothetical protein
MTRSFLIVAAVLNTFAGVASTAQADDGANITLARCRRFVPHCYRTYVYPRPNVYQFQRNDIRSYNNSFNNSINVYRTDLAPHRAAPFFSRTPHPQYETPADGPPMTPGRQYTLKVAFLCEHPGYVDLYIEGVSHTCPVLNWGPNEVTFELPVLGVVESGRIATLTVTRPDGFVATTKVVTLVNPPDLIEHEDLPAAGAPGAPVGMYPMAGPMLHEAGA